MKDLMMDTPLLITSLMEHAERNFPEQEYKDYKLPEVDS